MPPVEEKKSIFSRILGIDENYTLGDKIIAWSVFIYSFVYSFIGCFVGVIIWNFFSPIGIRGWSCYFFIVNLAVPSIIAVISTVWFTIGGIIDMRRMFKALAAKKADENDNGTVAE